MGSYFRSSEVPPKPGDILLLRAWLRLACRFCGGLVCVTQDPGWLSTPDLRDLRDIGKDEPD